MKREIRNAIAKAIKDSELNGYKWTITENGLRWSYLSENDGEFTFDENYEAEFLVVHGPYCKMAMIWFSENDRFADCKTLTDAYYLATKATIRKANSIY
ncbi:MAG: hypothetical protein IJX94_01495 [Clostridia bacterium]|nr:hypothetical protein [Clostridia bacterium]